MMCIRRMGLNEITLISEGEIFTGLWEKRL